MTDRRPPCHGLTHLYFPDHAERPEATAERLEVCRRICQSCELILACSIKAHTGREQGIWAGRLHLAPELTNPARQRKDNHR